MPKKIKEEIDYTKSNIIYSVLGEDHIFTMTTYLLKCLIKVLSDLEVDSSTQQRIKSTTLVHLIIHIFSKNSYIELIKK